MWLNLHYPTEDTHQVRLHLVIILPRCMTISSSVPMSCSHRTWVSWGSNQSLHKLPVQQRIMTTRWLCWLFSKRQRITLRLLYAMSRPSVCRLSVVCLSSVTLVHPTQAVELFGNFFHHTIAQRLYFSGAKSTTRFPTSHRWTVYVTPKSPKGWHKNAISLFVPVKFNFCRKSLLQSFFVWKLPAAKL